MGKKKLYKKKYKWKMATQYLLFCEENDVKKFFLKVKINF